MRQILSNTAAAVLALSASFSLGVRAADFPNAPITLYVQSAAGGTADQTARALGQAMTQSIGVSVVIMNEPAAGGVIALRKTGQAKPDGYTTMLVGTKTAVTAALQKNDSYSDLLKQVVPIAVTSSSDVAVVVGAKSKYNSLSDLVSAIKASPGKISIGVGDVHGGIQHIVAELFKLEMKGNFVIVPYKTASALTIAAQAGEVDAAIELLPGVMATVRSGGLRALAVTGRRPYPELKRTSSLADAGFPLTDGISVTSYMVAPTGTPAPVIAKLNREINLALAKPALRANSEARGARVATPVTPEQAKEMFSQELHKWQDIVQQTKVSVE